MPCPVLAFSVMSYCCCTRFRAVWGVLPFNPTDKPAVTDHAPSTPPGRFAANTKLILQQREATMSHFTGLAVQNFVSASAGMCVLAALIRGLALETGEHARQLLGRPSRPRVAHHVPLCRSWWRSCWSTRAVPNLHGFTVMPLEGAPLIQKAGRWPARSRSSSSAPTAAGSST